MKRCFTRSVIGQVVLAGWLALFMAQAKAAIPEPDLIWYGKVLTASGGVPVRVTTGTLVWRIEPLLGGPAIVLTSALTNVNGQFSFVLRVPCETPEPGVPVSPTVINLTSPPAHYRRVNVTLDGQPLSLISAATEFSVPLTARGQTERIDLQLGTALADTDGDGLADVWEQQHFGGLNANPADDPDGDGMSNLREYRAGTNPTDPNSLLELVEISKVANGVSIRWSSQLERSYRVRRSSNLLAPLADYQIVQAGLSATPPMNQFVDTTVGAEAPFFYLIEVEE